MLCNNRNSPITIPRVHNIRVELLTIMLLIFAIIRIVPCMHEIPHNTIKYTLHCVVHYNNYAIQYLVGVQYAIKIPTSVTNYSTKSNIFRVNLQQMTPMYLSILKNHYHDYDNINCDPICENHSFGHTIFDPKF